MFIEVYLALRGKDVDSERSQVTPHVASTWREYRSRRTQTQTSPYYPTLNLVTYTNIMKRDSNTERATKALQGRCARRFVVGDAPRLDRLETPGAPTLALHSIASPIGIGDPIAKPGSAGAILHRNASPVLSCAHGGYRCLCMHTARYREPPRHL